MMNFMKSCLTGALIDNHVYMPSPLKEQALRNIALTLCHNSSIRRQIFDLELDIADDSSHEQVRVQWEKSFNEVLTKVINRLFIPQTLEKQLIGLMRSMALQLLVWSGGWQKMFRIPCNVIANLWLPTDWIGIRLCEIKIAERTMENDQLTTDLRYRVACVYCLEGYIFSLWKELSPEEKENLIDDSPEAFRGSCLIYAWSEYLHKPDSFQTDLHFFCHIVKKALEEFQAAAFIFSWHRLGVSLRSYECVMHISIQCNFDRLLKNKEQKLPFKESLDIQLPKSSGPRDIFCFILMQICEMKVSGWEANRKDWQYIVKYFFEWPQEDFYRKIRNVRRGLLRQLCDLLKKERIFLS